jgi:hypothetical protein
MLLGTFVPKNSGVSIIRQRKQHWDPLFRRTQEFLVDEARESTLGPSVPKNSGVSKNLRKSKQIDHIFIGKRDDHQNYGIQLMKIMETFRSLSKIKHVML